MTRPRPLVPREDPADSVRVVGEFGVIARVLARAGAAPAAEVGPGDDAAVLRTPDGRVVATTDVLVEGRHFRRDWSSAEDIGHKAAAANLADVAAMGGVTTALLVGLACPPDTSTAWLEGVATGLAEECAPLGAAVVGGDTVSAAPDSGAVVLSVTALGDLGGRVPVLRSGARPGDVLALAGRLGWSACGLAVLRRGFTSPVAAVAAHRRPAPPYAAGPAAADAGATAMCDVSDGLLADAGHLAHDSGVVVDLDRTALVQATLEPPGPLQQVAAALGGDPLAWVLTGGEDHALIATFPPDAALPDGWTTIGAVREAPEGPAVLVEGEPGEIVAEALGAEGTGHVHFR
ncbi:thiamine-phosphate kinase [Geodermatophilus sabuli]|uniref:Thiamine-monophosphate kinase n=1 Tax=Geodermatophilus sabuli TaxID=1564158 RepID=A0A285EII6_9ACTN|nr:thiamine-phosphate kinase [Geodermatophilus sabuli]MBB3085841.1 thiamine-monophosphate kinase [Geodermatophilus sabuli]SNX98948.1 thiamine-phosphate kinase [Geodermatophilus sabuli]